MTSTRPDGDVVTITSTSYYDIEPTAQPNNDDDDDDDPDLQDAAPRSGAALLPVIGAVVGAMLL